MAATPDEQIQNLSRLRSNHAPHCAHPPAQLLKAQKEAWHMPLTHTTPERFLSSILKAGALLAADEIPRPPGKAEAALGTSGDVFLYLCSMAYPDNEFGFLFEAALTGAVAGTAVATPFDSGGCVAKLLPPGGEDCVAFVRRHELPVPECRDYLGDILAGWFASTADYIAGNACACACGTSLGDPHGLSPRPGVAPDVHGRSRIHEVRIPRRVPVTSPHLRAVFAPFSSGTFPGLGALQDAGVEIVPYDRPDAPDDSYSLRVACNAYILNRLLN